MCIYMYVERVNTIRVTEKGNVLGVKRERLVSQFLGKTWKKKNEARIRRRILRGLSTHRRQRASRRGFSLGERGLRKSSLPPPSLVSWNHSVFLVYFVSLALSPLSIFFSLERVSRSGMALPIGADTPRGVEADSTRVESFVRSFVHPPTILPLVVFIEPLVPQYASAVASLVRERHCYCRSCSFPLRDFSPVYIVFSYLANISLRLTLRSLPRTITGELYTHTLLVSVNARDRISATASS